MNDDILVLIGFNISFGFQAFAESVTFQDARQKYSKSNQSCTNSVNNNGFIRQFRVEISNGFVISLFIVIVFSRFFEWAEIWVRVRNKVRILEILESKKVLAESK